MISWGRIATVNYRTMYHIVFSAKVKFISYIAYHTRIKRYESLKRLVCFLFILKWGCGGRVCFIFFCKHYLIPIKFNRTLNFFNTPVGVIFWFWFFLQSVFCSFLSRFHIMQNWCIVAKIIHTCVAARRE